MRERSMKKKALILALVLGAIAVVAIASTRRGSSKKGLPVTLGTVRSGPIVGKVSGPGVVNPEAIVDISAHLPGKITRLAVREGDAVTKGQLLLELDRTQYEARAREARASVESQTSQVELARAQYEKAQADLRRAEDLHRRGLSSDQELELARTTARVEEARLRSTEHTSQQAVAAQQAAEDDLDKCRYTAPMDGVVSRLNVEAGEIAVTGTMNNPGTVLLSIADLSRMEVQAEIDETDVVDVRVGQPVKIKVDAFPDTSYAGVVTEIANTAITRSRGTQEEVTNFTVEAVFSERVPELRPGMTATVDIETARRDSVLKAPIQAIVSRNAEREMKALERNSAKGKKPKSGDAQAAAADRDAAAEDEEEDSERERRVDGVYVLRDGRAVFVPLRTGISDERWVEILSGGLQIGDKVVSGPYQTLRTLESGKQVTEKKDLDKKKGHG
jgi:HlyD family secretion protein